MKNTKVKIAGVELKNPVFTSSGTFGTSDEFADFIDINKLGGITTKGVAPVPWEGNPAPRVTEIPSGMMNCIGLENPGVDVFIRRDLPKLAKYDTVVMANVCGHSVDDYATVAERLEDIPTVKLLEINISCPNVSGGTSFGVDPKAAEEITKRVKRVASQPIIVKLSPNVTDITEIAKACESGGADGISLINSLTGMVIDVKKRKFVLSNKTGGMSGPAIRPLAVRMVYQAAHAVSIPVIGMGGIMTGEDAMQFIMAGATAVSVGMANFHDPGASVRIVKEIERFMDENGIDDINEVRGCV
ncbi:MAG: dihydroorotate dehydrogenase [Catonella sp.]|jgi:dihydroorotate dehydrogenase (NAD+) catalytic subunit|nr:dihydroorotate dehydrogenase [Catonella sp.]MDY6356908.1 dihydroorotate dehydrogenase [Catonella sp.]